jgi:hypothetical protein
MGKTNRPRLKDRFKNGRMPSEDDFGDLIDSMINILEEGFDKTPDDGLKISQLMGSGKLLSFYEDLAVDSPKWFLELGPRSESEHFLHFSTPSVADDTTVLTLRQLDALEDGSTYRSLIGVGINNKNPKCELDVEGTIASSGRMGKMGEMAVPADGAWYDITDTLTGCHAFEVLAGVGGEDKAGKYAMTHAIAMNAFNGKSSITHHQAHFGNRCNRIELQWESASDDAEFTYKLQMRVECAYGEDVWVKYHITQLWFDTLMEDSNKKPLLDPKPPKIKKETKK